MSEEREPDTTTTAVSTGEGLGGSANIVPKSSTHQPYECVDDISLPPTTRSPSPISSSSGRKLALRDRVWSWMWFIREHCNSDGRTVVWIMSIVLLLGIAVVWYLVPVGEVAGRIPHMVFSRPLRPVRTGTILFPDSLSRRLQSLPVGPQTSWHRAITFVDPNLKVEVLFDSVLDGQMEEDGKKTNREARIKEIQDKLAKRYEIEGSARKEDDERILSLTEDWSSISEQFVDMLKDAKLLPDLTKMRVERETAYVVPIKTTRTYKTWAAVEALRTMRVWPEEVVFSAGFEKSSNSRQDYRSLMSFVRMLYLHYYKVIPKDATMKLIFFDPEAGPWSSRLYGIHHTKASIVSLMDNDDFMYPDSIALKAELFRRHPELDYLLSGYDDFHFDTFENATQTVLLNGFVASLKTFYDRWNTSAGEDYMSDTALKEHLEKRVTELEHDINAEGFKYCRNEFKAHRRAVWYLGSISGMPNLGVQGYRYHEKPYKELLNELRERITELSLKGQLPKNPLDQFIDEGASEALVQRNLRLHREKQDEEYLDSELKAQEQDWVSSCHNGWSTGRRWVYLNVPPPIYQWQGEDSNYNFMVFQSGLNGICIGRWPPGLYTSWSGDGAPLFKLNPNKLKD